MTYFLDRAVYGSNSLIVDTSNPLGKGAQAVVYPCRIDGKAFAAKIFHSATHGLNVKKINAMINNPPDVMETVIDGIRYPKYSWPIALIRNQANTYVGYLMPLVDLKDSFTLDHYYDINLIKRLNSSNEAALSFKVEIAKNLAELVADLHSHKHFFIDFKPQNIRVFKGTHAVTLIDCDGFSINGKDNTQYPAELMSTDYIAPEVFKSKTPAQKLGEEQDLYALATIIFQLLNGGIHPFQGILKTSLNAPTNDEKAALALYPHGISANPGISPRPQSAHTTFLTETRLLFDKAFIGAYTLRPTANMWFIHLKKILDSGEIVRCSKYPSDVKHMRFKDMQCPECHRQAAISIAPQIPKSKIDYGRLNTPPRPNVNSRSSSGAPGGGYKSPTQSTGVSGWNALGKALMIFFGAMILVAILSNCDKKPTSTYSSPPSSHTPPIDGSQPIKKPWLERVNEIRAQINSGQIANYEIAAVGSKNISDFNLYDKSRQSLPLFIAASMESKQTWFVSNNRFYILLDNDFQETIESVVLTAYEGTCETKSNPTYIHLPLKPKLNAKSKAVYNFSLPIPGWSHSPIYKCVDIDFAYTSAIAKQTQPVSNVGWAAIYYSDTTKKYSWYIGATSKEAAQRKALENCNARQGNCREWATKQSKCFAIYANHTTLKMSLGFGSSEVAAMSQAKSRCEEGGGLCFLDDSIGIENASKCDSWSE